MKHYHLLYKSVSTSHQDANVDALDILKQSLTNNVKIGITGYLHVENGKYYQYIEGEKRILEQLFKHIRNDSRHFALEVLSSGPIEQRVFCDFDMGFAVGHGRFLMPPGLDHEPSPEEILNFMKNLPKSAGCS